MRLRLVHDLEDDGGEHVEPLAVPDRLVPARVGQENALQHQLWRGQLGSDTVLLIPQYDGFPESPKKPFVYCISIGYSENWLQ